jgi:glycine/D-amino acid oxidase-like deaminating enzyme
MRCVYGRSPWIDQFPKSRVPSYPKYRGDSTIDVVIVGGGLTGCATAYAFAAAGVKVALFEADRIGRGSSGASTGWITEEPAPNYGETEAACGRRSARHGWQAWRRAALDFTALLRRLDIKCAVTPRPALTVARTPAEAVLLARELKRRREASFDTASVPARTVPAIAGFPGVAGFRTRDNATIDPYRATLGLAAAAAKRGALIFERSPVTKTAFTRDAASVMAGRSTVRTRRVVVATGRPGALFKPLRRHVPERTTFLVLTQSIPATIRKSLGSRDHLLRDLSNPPHRIAWVDDDRLLVSGADGAAVPPRLREQTLVQRTGQLMYELSVMYPEISGLQPSYGWDAEYGTTGRGIPLIGPHRNYPFHLFAFGDSSHSVTGAYLASRILLRQHLDEVVAADAAFAFGR